MDLYFIVLNREFKPIAYIDEYISAIWTDRYKKLGDFEIRLPPESESLQYLSIGNYVINAKSPKNAMIIESFSVNTSEDSATDEVIITGRSIASILSRRIVWDPVTITGSMQDGLLSLFNANIISPSVASRRIPNVVFRKSTDSRITSIEIAQFFYGDNLFDILEDLSKAYGFGYRMFIENKSMVFELYFGDNKSVASGHRQAIVFSPEFDNLIGSNYIQDYTEYKNLTLVLGEEVSEGSERRKSKVVYAGNTEPTGIDRREMCTDADSVKSENDGVTMSDADYNKALELEGLKDLNEVSNVVSFDGSLETDLYPVYSIDYNIGDYVSAVSIYGYSSVVQITEYIQSCDQNGYRENPTFSSGD